MQYSACSTYLWYSPAALIIYRVSLQLSDSTKKIILLLLLSLSTSLQFLCIFCFPGLTTHNREIWRVNSSVFKRINPLPSQHLHSVRAEFGDLGECGIMKRVGMVEKVAEILAIDTPTVFYSISECLLLN